MKGLPSEHNYYCFTQAFSFSFFQNCFTASLDTLPSGLSTLSTVWLITLPS